MKYEFINLTPHDITIILDSENKITIPKTGKVARVSATPRKISEIAGIPVNIVNYGNIEIDGEVIEDNVDWMHYVSRHLEGKRFPIKLVFIVSIIVLQAMKQKNIKTTGDSFIVVAPDTNPYSVVRDSSGRIIGVKAFQTIVN